MPNVFDYAEAVCTYGIGFVLGWLFPRWLKRVRRAQWITRQ